MSRERPPVPTRTTPQMPAGTSTPPGGTAEWGFPLKKGGGPFHARKRRLSSLPSARPRRLGCATYDRLGRGDVAG